MNAGRPALVVIASALLLLAGCSARTLSPAPNLYAEGGREPFGALDPALVGNGIDLLYVTDRVPESDDGVFGYGYGRSNSAAFGSAVVRIGEDVPWPGLAAATVSTARDLDLPLSLGAVTELGRFPKTPSLDTADAPARAETEAALRAEIARRLALTPVKRVLLFVHGYNNSFADAAFDLAELWHFLGREGVPLLYTWPAGYGGARGYAYDRESGEFTEFHLKALLRRLGAIPDVESIQVVAHSRGADVATSVLRELLIELRAAGADPVAELRISELVLLAPDLDGMVFGQRFVAERVQEGVGRVTIYSSGEDQAIGISQFIFGGLLRLGLATEQSVTDDAKALLVGLWNVSLVEVRGESVGFGHTYFLSNPAALSDLILLLRDGRPPGAEHGRPLVPVGPNLWVVPEGYPKKGD